MVYNFPVAVVDVDTEKVKSLTMAEGSGIKSCETLALSGGWRRQESYPILFFCSLILKSVCN